MNRCAQMFGSDRRLAALVQSAQTLNSLDAWEARIRTCLQALRSALGAPAVGFRYQAPAAVVEILEPRHGVPEGFRRALRQVAGRGRSPGLAGSNGLESRPVAPESGAQVVVLPLAQGDAAVGAIAAAPRSELDALDLQTIAVLGGQLTAYLSHFFLVGSLTRERQTLERALEQERQRVEAFERAFRPTAIQDWDGYRVSMVYRPVTETESMSGDFYQLVRLDGGRLGILIGDVCGKGLAAAGFAAVARYVGAAYARLGWPPETVLEHSNTMLCEILQEDRFATAAYAWLEPASGRMELASAGHPPPLHYSARRRCVTPVAVPSGLPLGCDRGAAYKRSESGLEPGDTLLFYTDGVVECGPGRDASEALCDHLQELGRRPEALASRLFDALQADDGRARRDDCLLLALSRDATARAG